MRIDKLTKDFGFSAVNIVSKSLAHLDINLDKINMFEKKWSQLIALICL